MAQVSVVCRTRNFRRQAIFQDFYGDEPRSRPYHFAYSSRSSQPSSMIRLFVFFCIHSYNSLFTLANSPSTLSRWITVNIGARRIHRIARVPGHPDETRGPGMTLAITQDRTPSRKQPPRMPRAAFLRIIGRPSHARRVYGPPQVLEAPRAPRTLRSMTKPGTKSW